LEQRDGEAWLVNRCACLCLDACHVCMHGFTHLKAHALRVMHSRSARASLVSFLGVCMCVHVRVYGYMDVCELCVCLYESDCIMYPCVCVCIFVCMFVYPCIHILVSSRLWMCVSVCLLEAWLVAPLVLACLCAFRAFLLAPMFMCGIKH
jgi:hypothetical protein